MTRYGIDYAWSKPSPAAIRAAGYTFACRYLGGSTGKDLTRAEALALRAAGVDVVANWEAGARNALSGHAQGVADAREALKQANAAGIPAGRPIYFSVDFDATEVQQATINAYMDGVASVIGLARTGAYGGYYVVKRLFDAGKIRWGWQTYAWSGGKWDSRAHLRQIKNGITVGGADCDKNQAMTPDFGQWGYTSEENDLTAEETKMLKSIYAAIFTGGSDMGAAVPSGEKLPASVTGNSLADVLQHVRKVSEAPAPVAVDASAVAAALAGNAAFLAALAKAVNDDAARRLGS